MSDWGQDLIYAIRLEAPEASILQLCELIDPELNQSSYTSPESSYFILYSQDKVDLPALKATLANFIEILEIKNAVLEELEIQREDWAESWKKFFHSLQISERILIKPSWEESDSTAECIIEIDPGMSFGTGQHGTTSACLQFIDAITAVSIPKSFLDMGCGSGILSIAASKLGIAEISSFDFDPLAVEAAEKNTVIINVM
ncbi:MAG: 50S ribosomal protein L11 methyltransferase [Lentisphaeria bacterium]|nr:50S ribosomal protein L11 methyltransferase [Lentisphaeria bacterium]NQZ70746.1 50S ribosomal protein L11 methyltransferase [Lentisphaeria bacterium]